MKFLIAIFALFYTGAGLAEPVCKILFRTEPKVEVDGELRSYTSWVDGKARYRNQCGGQCALETVQSMAEVHTGKVFSSDYVTIQTIRMALEGFKVDQGQWREGPINFFKGWTYEGAYGHLLNTGMMEFQNFQFSNMFIKKLTHEYNRMINEYSVTRGEKINDHFKFIMGHKYDFSGRHNYRERLLELTDMEFLHLYVSEKLFDLKERNPSPESARIEIDNLIRFVEGGLSGIVEPGFQTASQANARQWVGQLRLGYRYKQGTGKQPLVDELVRRVEEFGEPVFVAFHHIAENYSNSGYSPKGPLEVKPKNYDLLGHAVMAVGVLRDNNGQVVSIALQNSHKKMPIIHMDPAYLSSVISQVGGQ